MADPAMIAAARMAVNCMFVRAISEETYYIVIYPSNSAATQRFEALFSTSNVPMYHLSKIEERIMRDCSCIPDITKVSYYINRIALRNRRVPSKYTTKKT
jgi:hypothetical protein